jgi:hypothetical protein
VDQRLKTGSRAENAPQGAITGFRSVAGLVKERHLSIAQEVIEEKKAPPKKPNKPRQRKAASNEEEERTVKLGAKKIALAEAKKLVKTVSPKVNATITHEGSKKTRKRPAKKKEGKPKDLTTASEGVDDLPIHFETNKRKRKASGSAAPIESLCVKPTIEGEGECNITKARKPKKRTGTVSSHFVACCTPKDTRETISTPDSPVGLNIEVAPKRRSDWTPTKDTTAHNQHLAERSISGFPVSPTTEISTPPAKASFSCILGGFAYEKTSPSVSPERGRASKIGLNKRRKIEVMLPYPFVVFSLLTSSSLLRLQRPYCPKRPT